MTRSDAAQSAVRHFLDLDLLDATTLRGILEDAKAMKAGRTGLAKGAPDRKAPLNGDLLLMIFQKSSTRTRISFEVAMRQLGGAASDLDGSRLQLGRGESIADTARVLSAYGDAIVLRTDHHKNLTEMAHYASIPVINALTDHSHPCQLMADMLTFEEANGPIKGQSVAWLGDGNNVATSMIHAAMRFDFRLRLACPSGHLPDADVLAAAKVEGADVAVTDDPVEAVKGARAIYTDTWSSMGQERAPSELAPFEPYRVTTDLMAHAAPDALFLHCLPAHRGEEVTDAVMDGPQSAVWAQAENRLHAQKAILNWCLNRTC
ncbi:ornithine carbamoyltransferase, catabolic [Iodidimonas muriae]|uniref:Ornithine carbamoyltransferase n=1 Tax=Iodidimonas muriae TaxID=261467 RepID=A0ABQ2L8W8_9PROT|nr:ornithine carbamoyltransferase [Iodidimonas muriae]GGO07078.1 ornithine carbamoyltransferase, catabolic [Iodidimonas muriae]